MTDPSSEPQQPAPPEPPPLPSIEAAPQPAPEREPFWGYRDLMFLIASAFLLLLAIGKIATLLFKPPFNAPQELVITFAFEGLWFAVLYGVMRFVYGRPFWRSLGWVKARPGFWKAAGWGVLTALACVAIASMLPGPHVRTRMDELLNDRSSLLLVGVFAVTVGPLLEELAFRGFLQPLLVSTFGAAGGVVLQAIPFAALHGAEYAWRWQLLFPLLCAGTAFGWMRHRTGSTAASTYMHAGFNFIEFLGMLAASFLQRS
jgi:uncharacterized protein